MMENTLLSNLPQKIMHTHNNFSAASLINKPIYFKNSNISISSGCMMPSKKEFTGKMANNKSDQD